MQNRFSCGARFEPTTLGPSQVPWLGGSRSIFPIVGGISAGHHLNRKQDRLLGTQATLLWPMLLAVFAIVYATFRCDFSAGNFLIVPNLHQNAAEQKLPTYRSLNQRELVGASRFELETSCAQGRRATRLRYAPT